MANLKQSEGMSAGQATAPLVESRRAPRHPLASPVRLGWINDDKRMEYVAGQGMDISESGLSVLAGQRLRVSALVHVDVGERELTGIGRVRNCIRSASGWRTGIELVPIP